MSNAKKQSPNVGAKIRKKSDEFKEELNRTGKKSLIFLSCCVEAMMTSVLIFTDGLIALLAGLVNILLFVYILVRCINAEKEQEEIKVDLSPKKKQQENKAEEKEQKSDGQ